MRARSVINKLPFVNSLITAILPGLALKIFLILVPFILTAMNKFAGMRSASEVDLGVVTRYFLFQARAHGGGGAGGGLGSLHGSASARCEAHTHGDGRCRAGRAERALEGRRGHDHAQAHGRGGTGGQSRFRKSRRCPWNSSSSFEPLMYPSSSTASSPTTMRMGG